MMVALLVAGMGLIIAGLAAIGLGIPYKEFSVGSTLIITGVSGVCSGAIVLALAAAVRELKQIARRLGPVAAGARPEFPPTVAGAATSPRNPPPVEAGFSLPRDQHAPAEPPPLAPPSAPAAPPWHEEATQRAAPADLPPPVSVAAPSEGQVKRRNLLFSSSSRKERERTQARGAEPLSPDLLSPELRQNPSAAAEPAPPSFDDAWPKQDRSRSVDVAPRRSPRTPSTFTEAQSAPPSPGHPPAPAEQPPVTVLKSGVVDGMAYSLYSDGSIEAQMPEGMMRFASIDELRSHLEQRP